MTARFEVAGLPAIVFGPGALARVPEIASRFGRRALLVTGARSLDGTRHLAALEAGLAARGISWERARVEGEPSPAVVDALVARFRSDSIEVVLGVGGGSALDAAKAVAGLLRTGRSVLDHLEGVGRGIPYEGPAVPFVAAPTTAGTGTEATRNAVLGERGSAGYKKSFRHEALVARWAVVDPDLLDGCPPELIAADGMDALTQLLEAYVSIRANPFSDALAESGLAAARDGLLPWFEGTGDPREARGRMAWASLLSGIALAQAGLGAVHGLSPPLGSLFPIPHGAVCGTLVAEATAANLAALRARAPESPALAKYARAAEILSGRPSGADDLAALLRDWTGRLRLPRLGAFGVTEADLPRIVAGCRGASMRTNPVELSDAEAGEIVRARI